VANVRERLKIVQDGYMNQIELREKFSSVVIVREMQEYLENADKDPRMMRN
jgi:hypothetical protein